METALIPACTPPSLVLPLPQTGAWEVMPQAAAQPQPDSWLYWLPRWLSRKSVTTQAVYASEIRAFLAWFRGPIAALTTVAIEGYQQYLVNAGDKPNTVCRKVATVCSLVTYIHQRDLTVMPQNIGAAVEKVKADARLAERILSEAEILRILDNEKNPRNLAMWRVMYGGGLRVSEVCGLRWQDVTWREDSALLSVLGKGNKRRSVLVYGAARAALLAIAPENPDPTEFVFCTVHGQMNRVYAVELVRAAAKRAGITRPVSPHWFRHASATHALERGAPLPLVSTTLGHSNLSTTGRYLHCRPSESMGRFHAV